MSSKDGPVLISRDSRFVLLQRADLIRCYDRGQANQRIPLAETGGTAAGESAVVAISPDGITAATGGIDGTMRLWNLQAGELWDHDCGIYRGHDDRIESMAFSPTARQIVTGGSDGFVRVWDLTRPQGYRILPAIPAASQPAIRFLAHNDQRLATVADGTITWQDAVTAKILSVHPFNGLIPSTKSSRTCALTACGTWIVFAGDDGRLRVFEFDRDGRPQHRQTIAGSPYCHRIAISDDGQHIATISSSGDDSARLEIWNLAKGAPEYSEDRKDWKTTQLAIHHGGRFVAAATQAGPVLLIRNEDSWSSLPLVEASGEAVDAFTFSPSGDRLAAVGGPSGHTFVWDASTQRLLWKGTLGSEANGLSFNADQTRLAAFTPIGSVAIFDVVSGIVALRLPPPTVFVSPLDQITPGTGFCLAGRGLYQIDGSGKLFLWETFLDPVARQAALREAAGNRTLDWHNERANICKRYPFAMRFHREQALKLAKP